MSEPGPLGLQRTDVTTFLNSVGECLPPSSCLLDIATAAEPPPLFLAQAPSYGSQLIS